MKPRIGIIGAGAIGSGMGGLLTHGGVDVTLIDQWGDHIDAMQRDGLRLSLAGRDDLVIPVRALQISELQAVSEPFDIALVAVKSYDTEWATHLIAPYLAADGYVLDCQNGINDERVAAIVGADRTMGCVITIGAGLYDPGHALRTDTRPLGFKVGELDGSHSDRAQTMADLLTHVAGSEVTTNLWGERWAKLAVNCMANPIAGLTGYGSAEVRSRADTRDICVHLAAEAIEVGRAHGHEIDGVWGIAAQRYVEAAAGQNVEQLGADLAAGAVALGEGRPSFLQDVLRKRRTEIDFLNGYVAARGRESEVPTPYNDAVVDLVHSFPVGELQPDPANLARLIDAVGGRP
jgi:2-dehydropantoate 2-reductase